MRTLTFFLLSFMGLSVYGITQQETQTLLLTLDRIIEERPLHVSRKTQQLDSLKHLLNATYKLEERYQLYHSLYKEYRGYRLDSALWAAEGKYSVAEALQNEDYLSISRINIAGIVGMTGMHKEAFDIINEIDRVNLPEWQTSHYYNLMHSLYMLMHAHSFTERDKAYYEDILFQYKDSILSVNDPNSMGYHLIKGHVLVREKKYDEVLQTLLNFYADPNNKPSEGVLAYELSEIYRILQCPNEQQYYLAVSAIADVTAGVKEYISLQKLAILLYQAGDIQRAYAYIKCAMEDASFCRARFRTLEIAEMLPIINAAYDKQMKREKKKLIKYLWLISILSVILVISIAYIWQQFNKLTVAKRSVKTMYEDIKRMNEDMGLMNQDLSKLNEKLSESNLVKEEYIGSVFTLCSSYIDKMESYRININRKLKSGQVSETIQATGTTLVTDELKEFFRTFDGIFLSIYPYFIDEFNSLLMEGEQIALKLDGTLPSELRVFALMRLGILDNSKIACFLHYSPQTVYNYKLKIHNKLKVSKEEFAQAIQQIGV